MAVLVQVRWDEFRPEQYDQTIDLLQLEQNPPAGFRYHIASESDRGITVTGIWDSADDFRRFVDERLTEVIQRVGVTGAPDVNIQPIRRIITPR